MAGPNAPLTTGERIGEELDALEERLTLLQGTYEKYFTGYDRRPPDKERKVVGDRIRTLRTANTKNTALRFRVQTLFARLITFERLWDRTLREMEDGTYRRDLFKARWRSQHRGSRPPPPPAPDEGDAELADAIAEVRAAQSEARHQPRSQPPPPPPLSDGHLRGLYETYLRAREKTGEPIHGVSYEDMASKIRAQVPQLMAKHKASAVDFKVVIKGGKAVLKAVPKP